MFHAYGEAGTEQAIKRYAKAYNKADVTTQWITSADFESKLFATLLTKNAPDVFEFHPQIQMVKSGQVGGPDRHHRPVKTTSTRPTSSRTRSTARYTASA